MMKSMQKAGVFVQEGRMSVVIGECHLLHAIGD